MQFLRAQKEVARYLGMLQNDSISGLSSDELTKIKNDINHEVRKLADMKPPFLHDQLHIKMQTSVAVKTVTGTKGIPIINDSSGSITKKHISWMLSDDTHRYRIVGVTGTTIELDYSTFTTFSTATTYTAYKDVYPLPHNCGRLIDIWYEDGDSLITAQPGTEFLQTNKQLSFSSQSTVCSQDAYTNRWNKYKFAQTSVTFTNGTISQSVGTTYAAWYDIGDVLRVDTATTDEYVHTIIGKSSDTLYLDRDYSGDTGLVDVYDNPITHTSYMSFWQFPDTEKDVVLDCYIRPQDMVSNTDECILLDRFMKVVIIGSVREDSISRGFLTSQEIAWYEEEKQNMKLTPYAGLKIDHRNPVPLGGGGNFRASDVGS